MTVSARRAAKKICQLGDWSVTNMKLQKILYIINMIHLGKYEEPLVYEEFEAWKYGPAVPSLQASLRMFGAEPITNIFTEDKDIEDGTPESDSIKLGCKHLLTLPAAKLVAMTHAEGGGWKKHYQPHKKWQPILTESIQAEYRKYC